MLSLSLSIQVIVAKFLDFSTSVSIIPSPPGISAGTVLHKIAQIGPTGWDAVQPYWQCCMCRQRQVRRRSVFNFSQGLYSRPSCFRNKNDTSRNLAVLVYIFLFTLPLHRYTMYRHEHQRAIPQTLNPPINLPALLQQPVANIPSTYSNQYLHPPVSYAQIRYSHSAHPALVVTTLYFSSFFDSSRDSKFTCSLQQTYLHHGS